MFPQFDTFCYDWGHCFCVCWLIYTIHIALVVQFIDCHIKHNFCYANLELKKFINTALAIELGKNQLFLEKFSFVHNLLRNDPKSSASTNIPSDRMFLWPTSKRPPMSAVSTNRFHWQWCCKGCNKKGQFEGSGDQSVLRSEPVGRCPSTRGFRSCCGGDAWELGKLVF